MPMGSSEGPRVVASRTPQSVRIARERDYHLSWARENFRRKEEEARGQKRKWSARIDSLFLGSDEDSEASAPPVEEMQAPALGTHMDPELSPPESQDGPENKRVRREVECTCYTNKEERCPRAQGLGLEKCSTVFAPARRKAKPNTERTDRTERTSTKLVLGNNRGKNPRAFQDLSEFMAQYHKFTATSSEADRSRFANNLRSRLENLMLFQFPDNASESPELKRFLDPATGIPQLFTNQLLPREIIDDAEVLYDRWNSGDLDCNLLRGIDIRIGTTAGKKTGHISRSLTPHHPSRKSCEYVGEGHLRNGQWFPYQICAVRDGAHGDHEAGIYGKAGIGALSVVLSFSGRTNTYANVDEGNEISYCGTRSKDENPTAGTNLLLESERNRNPIRVFRSARLSHGNPYRPDEGLRYDGLYECAGKEVLDQKTAMFRFKLVRLSDQKPIRNQGPYKRPTKREVAEFKEVKALLKQNNTA